ASMACQVLAHCDERYALPRSLLLWHPPAIVSRGAINSYALRYLAEQITIMARRLTSELLARMTIPDKDFWYHYRNETLWLASDLVKASPGFLTIVTNVTGLKDPRNLFNIQKVSIFGKRGGTAVDDPAIIYVKPATAL